MMLSFLQMCFAFSIIVLCTLLSDLFFCFALRLIIFMVVQVIKKITWEGRRVVWGVLCLSHLIVVQMSSKPFIIHGRLLVH